MVIFERKFILRNNIKIGTERGPDEEYIKNLSQSKIVINTDMQSEENYDCDNLWITHINGRYLEVLMAGALLLSPYVKGVEKYLTPEIDFITYFNLNDAIEKIKYYLLNNKEREEIALRGKNENDIFN